MRTIEAKERQAGRAHNARGRGPGSPSRRPFLPMLLTLALFRGAWLDGPSIGAAGPSQGPEGDNLRWQHEGRALDEQPSTPVPTAPPAPSPSPAPEPPYWGTIFLDGDIITPADPSSFAGLAYAGRGQRVMYDRRAADWITVEAFLFDARFDDGLAVEIQVNPEFEDAAAAEGEALRFARVIGQLPSSLRVDVETVWIHKGVEPFGGGNHNLLIHVGQAELYIADAILEETFVHEAAHSSLDAAHASAPGWLAAQAADGNFISSYARDNPSREDVAESFLPYLALRHRLDRIDPSLAATVLATIPNRVAYFDAQDLDLYPITALEAGPRILLPALGRAWGTR